LQFSAFSISRPYRGLLGQYPVLSNCSFGILKCRAKSAFTRNCSPQPEHATLSGVFSIPRIMLSSSATSCRAFSSRAVRISHLVRAMVQKTSLCRSNGRSWLGWTTGPGDRSESLRTVPRHSERDSHHARGQNGGHVEPCSIRFGRTVVIEQNENLSGGNATLTVLCSDDARPAVHGAGTHFDPFHALTFNALGESTTGKACASPDTLNVTRCSELRPNPKLASGGNSESMNTADESAKQFPPRDCDCSRGGE